MFDEEIKKEIIEKHGQAFYDELLTHYSKTNIQQRAEKEIEERDKQTRGEARREANIAIAKRHLEEWKKRATERPDVPIFQKRVREAEEELIRAGGNLTSS